MSDIVKAHRLALEKMFSRAPSDCINLGTGTGASVLEVLSAVSKATGKDVQFQYGPRRAGDPAMLIASNSKAKAELGWEPSHTCLADIALSAWKWMTR